jgi:hypothetical protein
MNPTLLLLESSVARRSAATTTRRWTDHDPTAHRHAVEIDATVRVSGGELRAQVCRVRSLSLGGAFVELHWMPTGTLVNITFGLPSVDERLSLDAVVHRSTTGGVSVLFDSPRAWELWVLWRYLTSLDEEADLEPTMRIMVSELAAAKFQDGGSAGGAADHAAPGEAVGSHRERTGI